MACEVSKLDKSIDINDVHPSNIDSKSVTREVSKFYKFNEINDVQL